MGFLGGLIGTIAGPAVAGALGFAGQESTNAANAAEAQKNREFQERMSSTAHQREVHDLAAAGLNPALAYHTGGSSTPSGSQARFDSSAGAGVSSAASAMSMVQEAATQSAQRAEILSRAGVNKATEERTRLLMQAEFANLVASEGNLSSQTLLRSIQGRIANENQPFQQTLMAAQARRESAQASSAQQSVRESMARSLLLGTQQKLGEFEIPMARNMAAAADTYFGKNIAPYLGSAKSVLQLLSPFRFGR